MAAGATDGIFRNLTVDEAEVGREDGRANALTVILPLKWWGAWWLVVWFAILRRQRWWTKKLDGLRFVSAIRWSVLPPLGVKQWWRWHPLCPDEDRFQLLFESNFDGDWDEYLDNFGAVIPWPLRSIVSTGVGFPGLRTPGLFKAYAEARDHEPDWYRSAYPKLTASDIREEVAAREGSAGEQSIAAGGFGRFSPRWTTFLIPLKHSRAHDATSSVRQWNVDRLYTNALPPTVHFVRLVTVTRPSASWLLITMTHDGDVTPIIDELLCGSDPLVSAAVRELLETADGVPDSSHGWWDEARFRDFLLSTRPCVSPWQLTYCAYGGYDAATLRAWQDAPVAQNTWPVTQ